MCLNSRGKITTDNFFSKFFKKGEITKGGNDRGYYGNLHNIIIYYFTSLKLTQNLNLFQVYYLIFSV